MSFRRAARTALDCTAWFTGLLAARERAMRGGLTILMYHRVLPDGRWQGYRLPSLAMPLPAFREQVRYLVAHYRIVTVSEGLELVRDRRRERRALVSLTFDDGYADNFSIGAPVLEKYGARATFYVTTGLVGTSRRPWFDSALIQWSGMDWGRVADAAGRLALPIQVPRTVVTSPESWIGYLKGLPHGDRRRLLEEVHRDEAPVADDLDRMMTPDQLAELARRGHEIGSHSVCHPLLPQLGDTELAEEIGSSRRSIAAWTGAAPNGFCYPNGDHDERVVTAVRGAGYLHACGTRCGINTSSCAPFSLLRLDMNPRRVTRGGTHDTLAMRAEISRLHEVFR